MTNQLKAIVIFDNGGGTTLQLGEAFAHHYDIAEQAANDYKEYIATGTTEGWEGNEEGLIDFEPEQSEIKNGGYYVMNIDDINAAVNEEDFEGWGRNVDEFIGALK